MCIHVCYVTVVVKDRYETFSLYSVTATYRKVRRVGRYLENAFLFQSNILFKLDIHVIHCLSRKIRMPRRNHS